MRNSSPFRLLLAAGAAATLVACGGSTSNSGGSAAQPTADVGSGQLQGAGATFPEPYYTKAFYQYNADHAKVSVNYQAIGSGGGIQQFTKGTVDFGASDVPMTATEVTAAGGDATLVQLPTTIGVAAISYNLSGVDKLKLDGATLAEIFLGKIKTWDDGRLKALNSGTNLPSSAITVVHRSDGSGTSYAFTDYLSKVSPDWKSAVGVGKSVQWPAGTGAKGNEGVGQAIKSTDGAIGYVELAYVTQSKLQTAQLKNHSGKFVAPSEGGATAAAASLHGLSPTNFSITDVPGETAYPISTYSWVFLKANQADPQKGKALVELFKWLVTGGQPIGKDLQYAPLPKEASDFSLAQLKKVKVA
ncbi:MAG: phosphate ABC transporter substrate-binding protein PstS [Candidatus Dormibacteraeota bacterium]|uniref:Phosphate-binding protein n=1 Tax=Candidatus Dormiibacter inghamiae TaxID=3127013 RepID=A0A934NG43_9BACT|nr:phosphate ABC transporter substrate-binding protein PstS [Candidatus Dormibacteraeota bacterium]MBJ7606849.1 phosphate ABC transporter substrate-binding protein PstS [Candidatus Dormibacteraeota bacterium]